MEKKLMGVFAPISTPFTADGRVDYEGLAQNVKRYAAAGLKGYLALGSNGENKSLSNAEKLRVLETIVQTRAQARPSWPAASSSPPWRPLRWAARCANAAQIS